MIAAGQLTHPMQLMWHPKSSREAKSREVYLGQGGGFSAPTLLIALVVAGVVGLGLTWLPRPLALIGTGGILVAIAPAIVYPLSFVLALCSLAAVGIPVVRIVRRTDRPGETSSQA